MIILAWDGSVAMTNYDPRLIYYGWPMVMETGSWLVRPMSLVELRLGWNA